MWVLDRLAFSAISFLFRGFLSMAIALMAWTLAEEFARLASEYFLSNSFCEMCFSSFFDVWHSPLSVRK